MRSTGVRAAASHAAQFRVDRDVCDAYLYLLGRLLLLRQEHRDLARGAEWNRLVHRDSSLDVTCSEAWIVVDESSCTVIDVPQIRDRYYTVHVVNLWGETIANLNQRTFPDHPYGTFALCLKDSLVRLPDGARRIDLPGRKARVVIHVELGASPSDAEALQRAFALHATGSPVIPATVGIAPFGDDELPGVEAFDAAVAVIASERDVNSGIEAVQAKVRVVAALVASDGARARIDRVLRQRSWGLRQALYTSCRSWLTPRLAGNYGPDWLARTAANLFELWSNTKHEVARYHAVALDGSETYVMAFDRAAPTPNVSHFWSVGIAGATSHQARVTSQSALQRARNGTLMLHFAPTLPTGVADHNWIQTPAAGEYRIEWRSYGPDRDAASGHWFPPPLQKISTHAAS